MANSATPNILEVLLCPICHDSVKDTLLCPKCCQHFCRNCICPWLNSGSKTCPQCRAGLSTKQLIKCPRFDELQEIINQDHSGSFCQQHSKQQVSLFCNQCEVCICVTCYFSESDHTKHKERVVPLEITFEYHKQKLSESLVWLQKRYVEASKALNNWQENEKLLQKYKDSICEITNISKGLISGEASANTLHKIMDIAKSVHDIRQKSESEGVDIPTFENNNYMPDPAKLTFRFNKFKKASNMNNSQESVVTSCGFKWSCQIKKTDQEFKYYLTLIHGKPSNCAVAIENQPERFLYLEPGKPVELETFEFATSTGNEGYELVIHLRQTYKDRCQQLQDYNKQLENAKLKMEEKAIFLRKLLYKIVPVTIGFVLYWFWHKCPVPEPSWHGLW